MSTIVLNGYKKNKDLTFQRSFLVIDNKSILNFEFSKNNSFLSDYFLLTFNLNNSNKKNIYITTEEYQNFFKNNQ